MWNYNEKLMYQGNNLASYMDHLHELVTLRKEAERNNDHERANQLAEAYKRLETSMRMSNLL